MLKRTGSKGNPIKFKECKCIKASEDIINAQNAQKGDPSFKSLKHPSNFVFKNQMDE